MPLSVAPSPTIALLHGAGYVGGELIRLLLGHPQARLGAVTSRTFAGRAVAAAHPHLRGQTDLAFTDPDALDLASVDVLLVAAEHGQSAQTLPALLDAGFAGGVVDLSADFRFRDPSLYEKWFGYEHPAPHLLSEFTYGLPEVSGPYPPGTRLIANPGCFATGITLALGPLAQHAEAHGAPLQASVTALTGASGSGARPKATTHFPTRDGNVRAYKVLAHQHLPEIQQALGGAAEIAFAPASGPWTRGIWGTAHLSDPPGADAVAQCFDAAYAEAPCVRCSPGVLPELRHVVRTPFCDIGWVAEGGRLVVGFALDNLLKGAASQAVQNMNRLLGLPDAAGLTLGPPAAALA